MKQPEDSKTIDLLDQVKRGRGRPRVENPLTPAERAKRYRESQAKKKSLMGFIRDGEHVTKIARSNEQQKKDLATFWKLEGQIDDLRSENTRLKEQLQKRDAESVTKKSDEVWKLECEIKSLKATLESYRQFQEQRLDFDKAAQLKIDGLASRCEDLQHHLTKRDAQVHQLASGLVEFMNARTNKKRVTEERLRVLLPVLPVNFLKQLK